MKNQKKTDFVLLASLGDGRLKFVGKPNSKGKAVKNQKRLLQRFNKTERGYHTEVCQAIRFSAPKCNHCGEKAIEGMHFSAEHSDYVYFFCEECVKNNKICSVNTFPLDE